MSGMPAMYKHHLETIFSEISLRNTVSMFGYSGIGPSVTAVSGQVWTTKKSSRDQFDIDPNWTFSKAILLDRFAFYNWHNFLLCSLLLI